MCMCMPARGAPSYIAVLYRHGHGQGYHGYHGYRHGYVRGYVRGGVRGYVRAPARGRR